MPTYRRRTSVSHKRQRTDHKKISPALINTLNNDCLAKIFSYLPIRDKLNVQTVCRHWRKNHQLAWRDVRALNFNWLELLQFSEGNGGGVHRILKACGCYLHELTMRFVVQSHILPIISKYCHNLTRLDIAWNFSDRNCTQWFPQMQRLKYLRLEAASQHFSEQFFHTLPHENFTELHLLVYLSKPRYQLPPVSCSALEKVDKLTILTLRGFSLISNMVTIINQKTSLTHLSLENCTIAEEDSLHLDHLRKLEHLNLGMFSGVNNRLLTEISKTCKSLKFLDLSGCNNVSTEGITKLQILDQLKELILNDITQISDEPLSKLHSLNILECAGCYNVSNNGIITLMKYAPSLEYLNLAKSNVSARVLTEAAEILRRKTNGMTLEICMNRDARRHWDKDDYPPLLIVGSDDFRFTPTRSGDDSSNSSSDSDRRNTSGSSGCSDTSDDGETQDEIYDDN